MTSDNTGVQFQTDRLREASPFPQIDPPPLQMNGESFHWYILYQICTPTELVSATIYLNAIRSRLREKLSKTGESYDIFMGFRFEQNFMYADYFWRWAEQVFDPMKFLIPLTQEEFDTAFQISFFNAQIGHEDRSFGLNVKLSISPEDEIAGYRDISFESCTEILSQMRKITWRCGDSQMPHKLGLSGK